MAATAPAVTNDAAITKVFRIPIYGGQLRLYTSAAALQRYRHNLTGADPRGPADGRVHQLRHPNGAMTYLVGWFDQRISTLSHELNHVALAVLERAGITATADNGEALCHLQGELMTLCGADDYELPLVQQAQ
jgi:hypothetical protein